MRGLPLLLPPLLLAAALTASLPCRLPASCGCTSSPLRHARPPTPADLLRSSRNLHAFQLFYRLLIQLLPAALTAPLYFSGGIAFGVVMQASSAFNKVGPAPAPGAVPAPPAAACALRTCCMRPHLPQPLLAFPRVQVLEDCSIVIHQMEKLASLAGARRQGHARRAAVASSTPPLLWLLLPL